MQLLLHKLRQNGFSDRRDNEPPRLLDPAILKSVQDKLIKQVHKKITFFQPNRNSVCYSNKKDKLYGHYKNYQI